MTGADRRNVPTAVLGTVMFACACVIGIAAEVDALPEAQSVRAAPARLQFNLTPQPTPAGGTDATATPTPRRIVIPTATADVAPTATQPVATSTPQSVIVVETAAPNPTSSPTPTLTPSPVPTATATPVPTATPTPAPAVAPTLAPVQTLRLDFTAADWRGGYFRGDAPGRSAVLRLTGLDDELGALNPVALDVNGQRIYEGPSPFLNWDGQGTGANAAWTTVEFTIHSGVLWSGS
ncbi:MAG: hypothetical protein K0Q71_5126, partial [Thermomicrobiales bacterium]|nr:hypothetical protein [Thermomicrobiales bacterium]